MHVSKTRFLADLTLGFADGLTVPFALTAGLSSLGRTETVVYAGLAEICAGCISMGIGGYLSARGESQAAVEMEKERKSYVPVPAGEEDSSSEHEVATSSESNADTEKGLFVNATISESLVERHLRPLHLPPTLLQDVLIHATTNPDVLASIADLQDPDTEQHTSPILIGLSVALGYILGGLIPLFPYFFVPSVGEGLLCSSVACVIALFWFGFGKLAASTREKRWILSAVWEGTQMALLGALAAGAAVLCIKVLNGNGSEGK